MAIEVLCFPLLLLSSTDSLNRTQCFWINLWDRLSLNMTDLERIPFGTFLLSSIILVFASGLKYFINGSITWKLLVELFLELSIDILTIIVSVLTTYYYNVSSWPKLSGLVFITLLFILVSSAIRRGLLDGKIVKLLFRVLSCIGCWLITFLGILFVYHIIT